LAMNEVSDQAQAHIESELHAEFRAMRNEMSLLREEIKSLQRDGGTAQDSFIR
jgi:hypothetical protein